MDDCPHCDWFSYAQARVEDLRIQDERIAELTTEVKIDQARIADLEQEKRELEDAIVNLATHGVFTELPKSAEQAVDTILARRKQTDET